MWEKLLTRAYVPDRGWLRGSAAHRAHGPDELPAGGYPWATPGREGVLGPDGVLDETTVMVDLESRTPVLAVGSNAAADVLARKLAGLLARGVPIRSGSVAGLGVGHSAHVSMRGYVAAAPVRQVGADVAIAVCWFDPEQLAAMDATEPNYDRIPLPEDLPCRFPDGTAVPGAQVYDSHHGVLAQGGRPLELTSQAEVLGWLAERLPRATAYVLAGEERHDRLADAGLREQIRRDLIQLDLRVDSGLRG